MITLTYAPNNSISVKVHRPRINRKNPRNSDYEYERVFARSGAPTLVGAAALSLDAKINKQNRGGGWGFPPTQKTQFSRKAKTWLYRAGGALEHSGLGAGYSAFFTGTLPGSSDAAVRGLARWTGYISNRITQWFRNNNVAYWGYAWEFQKRGALHIHAFASNENIELLNRLIDEFRPFWISILRDVSAKSGVDLFEKSDGTKWDSFKDMLTFRSRGEWVRKSVCAYLCKYLSKGNSMEKIPIEYYPARWWGMSSELKQLTEHLTETCTVELSWEQEMELALEIHEHLQGFAVKQTHYEHKFSEGQGHTFTSYVPSGMWEDCKYLMSIFDNLKVASFRLDAKIVNSRVTKVLRYFEERSMERDFFMNVMSELPEFADIRLWFPLLIKNSDAEMTFARFMPEEKLRMCMSAMIHYADMIKLPL